jgi:hypothetical protein
VIYGPGGIGKSSLAASLAEVGVRALVLDIGSSTGFLDVSRIGEDEGVRSWDDMRAVLHDRAIWQGYDAVVLDDMTKAEEWCSAWVTRNIKTEKGHDAKGIEGYGFGKGFTHLYESFLPLLGDLDAHIRDGRQVICLAHECTATVPNPNGDDWIRYEPRLQSPPSGKNSIRHRVKEWADHVIFIGYDVAVNDQGKGVGAGTRTIYPTERPTHMAKSRKLSEPIVYEKGSADLWRQLFGDEK